MIPKIEIKSLSKIFGDSQKKALGLFKKGRSKIEILEETGCVVAVSNVSVEIMKGDIFMIMGLSGSGKSTLIRCINSLIKSTEGSIEVDGLSLEDLNQEEVMELRRKKISMVFQHFALFPHKSVIENVEFGLKIRGETREVRRKKAMETLELVDLTEWSNHLPEQLSGGMKQRVGLARALANDPDILLMDEPFSALDPLIRTEMQKELLDIQTRLQKTIVFITHDFQEALNLGDRIAVMKDGEFVQVGTPEEIVGSPNDDYVMNFAKDADRGKVFKASSIMKPADFLNYDEDIKKINVSDHFDQKYFIVVDEGKKPKGVIHGYQIEKARLNGKKSFNEVLLDKINITHTSTPLEKLYEVSSFDIPVAIIDDEGLLVGQICSKDILKCLAKSN